MNPFALPCLALLLAGGSPSSLRAEASSVAPDGKLPLNVLYVGDTERNRAHAFAGFLSEHFQGSEAIHRDLFEPADAEDFDVVLLDWSQTEVDLMAMDELESPLGSREEWTKPLVLLDSAGLLMAGPWELQGSWG